MLRVYLAALPKIEAPALSPFRFRPGLLYWPAQLAAGRLDAVTSPAAREPLAAVTKNPDPSRSVTSSAARNFCFRCKTGMSRLFRTYRAPLSQYAMM